MMKVSRWSVDVYFAENAHGTAAQARLLTRDAGHICGRGSARYRADGRQLGSVEDILAVSRALADLSGKLREIATCRAEAIEGDPVLTGGPRSPDDHRA